MSLIGIVGILPCKLNKAGAAMPGYVTRLLRGQDKMRKRVMVEFSLISRSQGT